MAEVKEEIIKSLWCPRCQRGMTGVPTYDKIKAGDKCPLCSELHDNGHIGSDMVAKLWETKEWIADVERRAKMERELKSHTIKHIETGSEAKVRDLQEQLDEMKLLVKQLQSKNK